MKEPVARHEKIRFRRDEVTGLHTYPSAWPGSPLASRSLVPRWLVRGLKWTALAFGALVLLVFALLAIIPATGIESAWLRGQAERAIARLAGDEVDVRLGRATLALDRRHFLAIGIHDLSVSGKASGERYAQAGRLGLGVRFWPLLSGKVEVGSATVADATISLPGNVPAAGGDAFGSVLSADGLIEPDGLLDAVFTGIDRAIGGLGPSGLETVTLRNVELVGAAAPVMIDTLRLSNVGEGTVEIAGSVAILDHIAKLAGEAQAPVDRAEASRFSLDATVASNGRTYEFGGSTPEALNRVLLGDMSLHVEGRAEHNGAPSEISLSATVAPSSVTIGPNPEMQANAGIGVKLTGGTGSLWIERFYLETGRSRFAFSGLITPQPATDDGDGEPSYAFRLIGPDINVAPLDSPEPALAAIARVGGWLAPDGRRIVANEIAVATGQGEVIGSGALEIVPGKVPGLSLAIAVADMPVSHAKNLWPFFAAPAAREWALANVFGGTVQNSRLLVRAAPGRLAPGIPMTAEEVSGHFEVENARFDVAGTIPPMRDAVGVIDFAGTDVDISLKSGTIFTESGRTLSARNGTFHIDDAHIKPLIGHVDVEIDGAAAAVLEVAGYEPINLSDYLPISPDGISGMAKGRLQASIPLANNVSRDDLDWWLELDYEGLALAEPYEGQRIEDAEGTIIAGPESAEFEASALLNGIRGELSLSEPLGDDKSERRRKARLFLEPGDSDKLFDGLSSMVSGPMTLDVEQIAPGKEMVSVDLTRAVFSLPWIGWSKAKGVAATADFTMIRDGETVTLEDLKLNGDGFGGAGTLTVDERGLASARFGRIGFSPGDNIAMGIDRTGDTYMINVSGQKLDARFLIKEFASMQLASGGAAASGGGGTSVRVDAEVSRVTGFNGEEMVGAKLAYTDAASNVPGMRISVSTPAGARATIVDASAGGARKVEVKADDTGAVLRFLDVYDKLDGGRAALSLSGQAGGSLRGQLEIRDFSLINEAALQSMVDRTPPGDRRSLNEAVRRDVDVSRAQFQRGFASVEMGGDTIQVANGVVSGATMGSTFEGTVIDPEGNMTINGTFLPIYGINRIFGEIPVLGQLLGNGRGGGLIGITYRLSGPAGSPNLEVNPLSIVAPGIFRSIFEYR
ncbi:MAG: hypothetical protein JJ913_16640 [Rhizobiaceae bacterium]|nr:hypothetical protein [Rhizobiaceae bacterium]